MKITANELRVNNWVQVNLAVTDALSDSPSTKQKQLLSGSDIDKSEWYEPIELTPQILIECGFEKEERGKESDFDGVEIVYTKDGIDIHDHTNQDNGFLYATYTRYPGRGFKAGYSVKSLHHLQNIFHALTSKELNYSPAK